MRKAHLIYILTTITVVFSSVFLAPSSVYARMGMPDVNVAGLNDDGSTLKQMEAEKERETKKAQSEAPAPINAQNNIKQPSTGQAPSQPLTKPNAVANFQNNSNIPKDPGEQHVGMLDNDKNNSPVDLKDQSGMNQTYVEPSKDDINNAMSACVDALKEDGTDENKAKTVCASPVGREYAFCIANVNAGKFENITEEDCLQTMKQSAVSYQDTSNNTKNSGLIGSLMKMLGETKDNIASLMSSAGEKISEWWDSPNKAANLWNAFANHIMEHPIESLIDVAMIAVAIAGAIPTGGGSVIAVAGTFAGRKAFSIVAKEAALGIIETITKNGAKEALSAGLKTLISPLSHPVKTARFLTGAVTDYITGTKKRVDLVNAVGKARYGDRWGDGAKSLEDMRKLSIESWAEKFGGDKKAAKELGKLAKEAGVDISRISEGDISTRMGEKAVKAYNKRYKWTGRALAGGLGADGLSDLFDSHIPEITTEARENDANYDMNASTEEKMNNYRKNRTKADIIHDAYIQHINQSQVKIAQDYYSNLQKKKRMPAPGQDQNKINQEFNEKYGFDAYSEAGKIDEIKGKSEAREAEEKNKLKFK